MKAFLFDVEMAKIYGVENAVMIWNLQHWIEHNESNGKHYYNGRYWTYNSIDAYTKIFPFWSRGQIRRILKSLEENDVIVTGNFNEDARVRTIWYAFTDSFLQMHLSKSANGNVETGKCIDIVNNDSHTIITDKNTNIPADGGLFPSEPEIEKVSVVRQHRTSETSACLFANSRYADFEKFSSEFTDPKFAGIDIAYYFHAVADWSAGKGNKMKDWIATARNFIRRDIEEKKVHRIGGGLTPDAIQYLQDMAD